MFSEKTKASQQVFLQNINDQFSNINPSGKIGSHTFAITFEWAVRTGRAAAAAAEEDTAGTTQSGIRKIKRQVGWQNQEMEEKKKKIS